MENSNSATTRDLEGAALRLKEPGVIGPTVSHQDAIGPVVGPLADRGDDGARLRLKEPRVIGPSVSHQNAIGPAVGPLADTGDDGARLRLHEPARGSDPAGPR